MTPKEVEKLMAVLLEKRVELRTRTEAIRRDVGNRLSADSKEQAVELENSDVLAELGREAIEELGRINLALARIKAGNYGTCVACGEDIGSERLRSLPWALRCMDCEREASDDGRRR